ncbi:hypothetical protein JMJ55_23060 [Belnapia sp. T6]|uniref:Uncharacterized protein n=1 Tax=Belnapia mucosa TaxID=2804532 RepID=A0ABS1V976_9PROT|nr:hypothetical protein [Belnapia mucosa]
MASGKDDRRSGFQAALARCRPLAAVLVATRLDRVTPHLHAVGPAGGRRPDPGRRLAWRR